MIEFSPDPSFQGFSNYARREFPRIFQETLEKAVDFEIVAIEERLQCRFQDLFHNCLDTLQSNYTKASIISQSNSQELGHTATLISKLCPSKHTEAGANDNDILKIPTIGSYDNIDRFNADAENALGMDLDLLELNSHIPAAHYNDTPSQDLPPNHISSESSQDYISAAVVANSQEQKQDILSETPALDGTTDGQPNWDWLELDSFLQDDNTAIQLDFADLQSPGIGTATSIVQQRTLTHRSEYAEQYSSLDLHSPKEPDDQHLHGDTPFFGNTSDSTTSVAMPWNEFDTFVHGSEDGQYGRM